MTEPPPPFVPYATAVPAYDGRDAEHLRLLAIMHYVMGGIVAVFSSIGIIHVVIGLTVVGGGTGFASAPGQPAAFGWLFVAMGSCIVTCGWTLGGLNILVGRRLGQRRARTLAMVVAGINCLWVPFGTALGVFTFIVLGRDSVRQMFVGPAAYAD